MIPLGTLAASHIPESGPPHMFAEGFEGRAGLPAVGAAVTEGNTGFSWVRSGPVFATPSVSGSRSMRCAPANAESFGQYSFPARDSLHLRVYVRRVSGMFAPLRLTASGTVRAWLLVNPDGVIFQITGGWSYIGPASSVALPANEWTRLEWEVTQTTLRARLFIGANLHGRIPDWDSDPQLNTLGGTIDTAAVGVTMNTTAEAFLDDFALNETTWPGPT